MLGCSNTQKYLNFSIVTFLPIWGPWGSLNHGWGLKKTQKNVFFEVLKAKMVIKILSKPFLKRKYCWSAFLIPIWGPIWGPRLPGSTKGAIFDIRFSKNVVFHIKIATPGAPNSTVQKYNISTFTGKKKLYV